MAIIEQVWELVDESDYDANYKLTTLEQACSLTYTDRELIEEWNGTVIGYYDKIPESGNIIRIQSWNNQCQVLKVDNLIDYVKQGLINNKIVGCPFDLDSGLFNPRDLNEIFHDISIHYNKKQHHFVKYKPAKRKVSQVVTKSTFNYLRSRMVYLVGQIIQGESKTFTCDIKFCSSIKDQEELVKMCNRLNITLNDLVANELFNDFYVPEKIMDKELYKEQAKNQFTEWFNLNFFNREKII